MFDVEKFLTHSLATDDPGVITKEPTDEKLLAALTDTFIRWLKSLDIFYNGKSWFKCYSIDGRDFSDRRRIDDLKHSFFQLATPGKRTVSGTALSGQITRVLYKNWRKIVAEAKASLSK